jgi:hypothetical protein
MGNLYPALVVGGGIAANLLIAGMFLARVYRPASARTLGFAGTAMAFPLAAASFVAVTAELGAWQVLLPLVFVVFAVIEVAVDVVLDVEVRETRWLWAYLAAFYLAQWALIGAAFLAAVPGGFAVLMSYFLCLGATAWSYRRVGHGATTKLTR